MNTLLSFVIPCYRSEMTIKKVIDEIIETVSQHNEIYDYEIICVNDCSPDNTLNVLKSLAEKEIKIKVVDLAINSGKHAAMMAGYSVASGDIIVNLDDDGQCPMNRLWDLIAPLGNEYDVSIARYPKKKQSAFKNFGSRLNAIMARHLINKPKELQTSNFSAFKRFVMEEMLLYKNPYPYISGLILRTTSKITNVDMEERERFVGRGNYTFRKSLSLWLNGFTAFSVKPLRIATVSGFIFAFIGAVLGIFIVIRKLLDPEILMGYSSTMAAMLFIAGVVMIMLGLIGEYIGRIYICINNSPQYVIRNTINCNNNSKEMKQLEVRNN